MTEPRPRRTFQQQTRARELFNQGRSCNAIARELGVGVATISRWAKSEGLTFERVSATREATAARQADLRDLAAELAREMQFVALQELKRARSPYLVFAFAGKSGTYREHVLPLPPAAEVRSMQTTAAVAFDKLAKAHDMIPDDAQGAALSVLDRLESQMDAEFEGIDDAEFGVVP